MILEVFSKLKILWFLQNLVSPTRFAVIDALVSFAQEYEETESKF